MSRSFKSSLVTFLIVAGSSLFFCSKAVFVKLAYRHGLDAVTTLAFKSGFPLSFFERPVEADFPLGSLLFRAHADMKKATTTIAALMTTLRLRQGQRVDTDPFMQPAMPVIQRPWIEARPGRTGRGERHLVARPAMKHAVARRHPQRERNGLAV